MANLAGVTSPTVVVLDHGSGNLRSAERALARAGADVTVTADPHAAAEADGLVVPGVGAFAACMAGLRAVGGRQMIGRRLAGGRPVLGICVGMQVLFDSGVEHGVVTEGCGEWPGTVERLTRRRPAAHGLEHRRGARGQPAVRRPRGRAVLLRALLRRTPVGAAGVGRLAPPLVTWAEHGEPFVAAVENGPLIGDPVPPGEVRRRRRRAAAQLGAVAVSRERARRREEREQLAARERAARERREARAARRRHPPRRCAAGCRAGSATAGSRGCSPAAVVPRTR